MGNLIPSIRCGELTSLFNELLGHPSSPLQIDARALRGGLDSDGVTRVTIRCETAPGKVAARRFVVKRLCGERAREARIYQELLPGVQSQFAPSLAGVREADEACWLVLEPIRPINNWPWRDTAMPARVLRVLAELHAKTLWDGEGPNWLRQWNYEAELAARSRHLVTVLERLPRSPEVERLRDSTRAVRRLAASLPRWRQWLMELPPFGRTFIHGDVHPGNVMIRKTRDGLAPVFVDWGRSRIGSPLEDVSSWLQSLGFWEPTARQRHDSLLLEYLEARGLPRRMDRELRDAYWLAAASNLLAGAVLYHLAVCGDPASSKARRAAALASAADGLRVIRRADACWRSRAR